MQNFYNGYNHDNAIEFDNRWSNVTQKSGYKSQLGSNGRRLLNDGSMNVNSRGLGYSGPSNAQNRDRYAESRGLGAPQRSSGNDRYAESRGLAAPQPSFTTSKRY